MTHEMQENNLMAVIFTKYVMIGVFADYIHKCMLMCAAERITLSVLHR